MSIDPIHSTDEKLLHLAVNNTFRFLNGKKALEEVKPGSWLLSNAKSIETIDSMIEYYISIEAYERCARLVQIKESILVKETTVWLILAALMDEGSIPSTSTKLFNFMGVTGFDTMIRV